MNRNGHRSGKDSPVSLNLQPNFWGRRINVIAFDHRREESIDPGWVHVDVEQDWEIVHATVRASAVIEKAERNPLIVQLYCFIEIVDSIRRSVERTCRY